MKSWKSLTLCDAIMQNRVTVFLCSSSQCEGFADFHHSVTRNTARCTPVLHFGLVCHFGLVPPTFLPYVGYNVLGFRKWFYKLDLTCDIQKYRTTEVQ